MLQTGDLVWDDATGAFYTRLNLEAALDAIMPQDEYGSSAATAYDLGMLDADEAMGLSGLIAKLNDVDYFRFTAGATGTACLTLATDVGAAGWVAGASAGTIDPDGVLSFSVVAGTEYVVAVQGDAGLAQYNLQVDIEAAVIDWGTIDFANFENINTASAESWYTFRAARDGLLTVQAQFEHAAGNVDIELYDAAGNLLASSRSSTNHERLDLTATEGQPFLLRVTGIHPQVDIRVTNLVVQVGDTVSVFGTDGDDFFSYQAAERHRIAVNGVRYSFNSQDVSSIQFEGGGGADRAHIIGSAADETAVLSVGSATLQSTHFDVSITGTETIIMNSGGGEDQAHFYDSAGDDLFVAHAERGYSVMQGEGFRNLARGFHRNDAYATAGGANDRAYFYDSAGDDIFVAHAEQGYSVMSGENYHNSARGFQRSYAFATAGGGDDRAYFHDSAGDDIFVAHAEHGYSLMRGAGYRNFARGFHHSYAYATAGGVNDRAYFYDSEGDDVYEANVEGGYSLMRGEDYSNYARGFHRSYAFAIAGGMDTTIYREIGDGDSLYGRGNYCVLRSTMGEFLVQNFESVSARAKDGQRPAEDVAEVDYLFSKLGDWQ